MRAHARGRLEKGVPLHHNLFSVVFTQSCGGMGDPWNLSGSGPSSVSDGGDMPPPQGNFWGTKPSLEALPGGKRLCWGEEQGGESSTHGNPS